MRESDEEPDLDFEIMTITKQQKNVGAQVLYTVLDYEQREHYLTLQQIEVVAKKQDESMQMFIDWLGGPKAYEKLYEKSAPKAAKKAIEQLPAKRQRKPPTVREYQPPVV